MAGAELVSVLYGGILVLATVLFLVYRITR